MTLSELCDTVAEHLAEIFSREELSTLSPEMLKKTSEASLKFVEQKGLYQLFMKEASNEDLEMLKILLSIKHKIEREPKDFHEAVRIAVHNTDIRWLAILLRDVRSLVDYGLPVMEQRIVENSDQCVISKMVDGWREEFVGSYVNLISPRVPAFVQTYGSRSCKSINAERGGFSCAPEPRQRTTRRQLLTEYVPNSKTLYEWLIEDRQYKDILSVLTQVFANLTEAHRACGFVHGDLHLGNVLVSEAQHGRVFVPIEGKLRTLETPYRVSIIDYGLSSVRHKGKLYVGWAVYPSNYRSTWTDIFRLFAASEKPSSTNEYYFSHIWKNMSPTLSPLGDYYGSCPYSIVPSNKYAYEKLPDANKIVGRLYRAFLAESPRSGALAPPHITERPSFTEDALLSLGLAHGDHTPYFKDQLTSLMHSAGQILERTNAKEARVRFGRNEPLAESAVAAMADFAAFSSTMNIVAFLLEEALDRRSLLCYPHFKEQEASLLEKKVLVFGDLEDAYSDFGLEVRAVVNSDR